jgi:CRP-like cAMP-binding protein
MYVVVEGRVAAMTPGPLEFELANLGEGDFFGEIGLLADQPRQATIVAREDTRLLEFDRALVARLSQSEPDMVRVLLRFVRERLVASLVATNPLFAALSEGEARQLTEKFQFLEVGPGTRLIEQYQPSGGVYILLTGAASVEQSGEESSKRIGVIGPGDIVGELSLLNRKPAMATVVVEQKSYVLKLPASDFTSTVMMHPVILDYVARIAADRERAAAVVKGPNSSQRDDWVQLV